MLLRKPRTPFVAAHRISIVTLCVLVVAGVESHAQFGGELPIAIGGAVLGLASGDLDGDGDLDVIVARRYAQPALAWYANLGGGAFGPAQAVPAAQPHEAYTTLTLDYDGDLDVDIISDLNYYVPEFGDNHQIVLLENTGNGNFVTQTLAQYGGASLSAMELGDLEGDGDEDLFFGVWTSDKLNVLKNTEQGFPWPPFLISSNASGTRDILPADVDTDGDADLLVSSSSLEEFYWFENLDGTEAFGHKQILDGDAPGARAMDAADLDDDGDLDLLATVQVGNLRELRWYENLGAGAFGSAQLISDTGFPGSDVLGVDIDGDGDIDALSADWYGPSWYANDGAGNFGPRQEINSTSVAVEFIDAPDLTGDGVPDVVFACSLGGDGKAAWHEGLSPAVWTDLGFALAGSAGLPSLAGAGPLAPGSAGSLALTAAAPSAPAVLFIAVASTPTPFKCGTLVPLPAAASLFLATSAAGSAVLAWTTWPAGLSGLSLYLQYAIHDGDAVCGVALSNALRADLP
jgi:hypothetical protein